MSSRPSEFPRWGNVGGDLIEPPSGKKDIGWVPDEQPPAQYLNWLQNYTRLWIEYLDTRGGNLIVPASAGFSDVSATGWAVNTLLAVETTTNTALWLVPLSLNVGDKIESATFRVKPNGAGGIIQCGIFIYADEVLTDSEVVQSTNGNLWEDVAVTGSIVDHVVAAGEYIFARGAGVGAGNLRKWSQVEITYDHPA